MTSEENLGGSEEWRSWEPEWLSSEDVDHLCKTLGGLEFNAGIISFSPRKWLLFILACIRHAWHVFSDERSRRLIEEVAPYADGLITRKELWERAARWTDPPNPDFDNTDDADACSPEKRPVACLLSAWGYTQNTPVGCHEAWNAAGWARDALGNDPQEQRVQVAFLHDIFGNPFHPIPWLDSLVLAWNEGMVRRLAQAIYDESDFERLPILADALEDAGCIEPILLSHLRGSGPHVRGCWALDLILGLTELQPVERDVSWS